MPITSPSPRRALVLIDIQNEYIDGNLRIEYPPLDTSLPNIARAIETAQSASIPLIVVQQMAPETSPIFAVGSHGWDLHSMVSGFTPALLVQKKLPSALANTGLSDWLRAHAIDTVTVAGYMTQNCNESTIRQAAHEGWNVEFLHDASGAVSYRNHMGLLRAEDMHKASCIVIQSRFAEVMSTSAWVDRVKSGTPSSYEANLYISYQKAHESAALK